MSKKKNKKTNPIGETGLLEELLVQLDTPTFGDAQMVEQKKSIPVVNTDLDSSTTTLNDEFLSDEYDAEPIKLTKEEVEEQNIKAAEKRIAHDKKLRLIAQANTQAPPAQVPPPPPFFPKEPIKTKPIAPNNAGAVNTISNRTDASHQNTPPPPVPSVVDKQQDFTHQQHQPHEETYEDTPNYQEEFQEAGHGFIDPERQGKRQKFVGKWGVHAYNALQKSISILAYQKVNSNEEVKKAESILYKKIVEGTASAAEKKQHASIREYLLKCGEREEAFVGNSSMNPEMMTDLQEMLQDIIEVENVKIGSGSIMVVAGLLMLMPIGANILQIILDKRSNNRHIKGMA